MVCNFSKSILYFCKARKTWLEQKSPKGSISPSLGMHLFPVGAVGVCQGFGLPRGLWGPGSLCLCSLFLTPSGLLSLKQMPDCWKTFHKRLTRDLPCLFVPLGKTWSKEREGRYLMMSLKVLLTPVGRLKSFPYCFHHLCPENSSPVSGSSAGSIQQRLT